MKKFIAIMHGVSMLVAVVTSAFQTTRIIKAGREIQATNIISVLVASSIGMVIAQRQTDNLKRLMRKVNG